MIDENACRGSWTLGKSGILICAVEEKGGSAAWSVNHGWFALWYLQLSQNWRLPSVKISDFVTAMYRGIDTLIGYVLFRPRSPANQTSRSLSSIQTIYTILEPPCSTCPFPYPFLDHIQIWTKTRRNETLSHRVEIVDRLQSGVTWSVSDSRREETTRKGKGNFVREDLEEILIVEDERSFRLVSKVCWLLLFDFLPVIWSVMLIRGR